MNGHARADMLVAAMVPDTEVANMEAAGLQSEFAERLALVHRQYRGASCPLSLQPYSVLPIAASVTGSFGACCRRATYTAPAPPLRAHGSLGRKDAAAHFLSRDTYPHVGA
jgi:hypothetical protein